jgi:hypothetical protein
VKLARFHLSAFQRQEQALFPKGIVTTRRQGNRGGPLGYFFGYPSILHNFTARLVPPASFVSFVIHCYYYRVEQIVKSLTNVTRFTTVFVITNTRRFTQYFNPEVSTPFEFGVPGTECIYIAIDIKIYSQISVYIKGSPGDIQTPIPSNSKGRNLIASPPASSPRSILLPPSSRCDFNAARNNTALVSIS